GNTRPARPAAARDPSPVERLAAEPGLRRRVDAGGDPARALVRRSGPVGLLRQLHQPGADRAQRPVSGMGRPGKLPALVRRPGPGDGLPQLAGLRRRVGDARPVRAWVGAGAVAGPRRGAGLPADAAGLRRGAAGLGQPDRDRRVPMGGDVRLLLRVAEPGADLRRLAAGQLARRGADALRDRGQRLARHRLRDADLPRRPAHHPDPDLRGGAGGWRRRRAPLLGPHAAEPAPHRGAGPALGHDVDLRHLRPDPNPDQRRPRQPNPGHRPLRLRDRVPGLRDRLRLDHRGRDAGDQRRLRDRVSAGVAAEGL
ncbi:MAG: hypothetical protein AVDCRST_MAG73-924, partial [uncultured Thermomicrobiales bacterium]